MPLRVEMHTGGIKGAGVPYSFTNWLVYMFMGFMFVLIVLITKICRKAPVILHSVHCCTCLVYFLQLNCVHSGNITITTESCRPLKQYQHYHHWNGYKLNQREQSKSKPSGCDWRSELHTEIHTWDQVSDTSLSSGNWKQVWVGWIQQKILPSKVHLKSSQTHWNLYSVL